MSCAWAALPSSRIPAPHGEGRTVPNDLVEHETFREAEVSRQLTTPHPLCPIHPTCSYFINDDGLIYQHFETWDISALDAFASCFFPSFGAPPAPPIEQLREGA